MSGVHVIRKQIFQFELEEAAQYRMLADKIRAMGDRVLPEALDKVLSEFVPDDIHLVIDKLELDIGSLRPEDLADQLIPRIIAALRTALQAVRKDIPSTGVVRVAEGPERQSAILRHFVVHGRLPWWAGSKNISIRSLSGALLRSNPQSFRGIFEQVYKDGPRLRRLLQHLDMEVLIDGWMRSKPDAEAASLSDVSQMVKGVVHQLQTSMGRDAAVEIVRLHLLKSMLGRENRPEVGAQPVGISSSQASQRRLSAQIIPVPLRAFFHRFDAGRLPGSDLGQRKQAKPSLPGAKEIMDRSSQTISRDQQRIVKRGVKADEETDTELEAFGGYLHDGRMPTQRARSMRAEVIHVFTTLIAQRLPELAELIRDQGRAERVRRRILDNIPSPRLRSFFEAAVPGKREAIEWVEAVYVETQRKVRPINQTNIRVQRSVDEITLELFTTTDLNAMGNAAFLRLHIQRMALKHHIRYRDLIRAIWNSSSLFEVSPDGRLYQILKELYEESFPSAIDRSSLKEKGDRYRQVENERGRPSADIPSEGTSLIRDPEQSSIQALSAAERRFLEANLTNTDGAEADTTQPDSTGATGADYRSRINEDLVAEKEPEQTADRARTTTETASSEGAELNIGSNVVTSKEDGKIEEPRPLQRGVEGAEPLSDEDVGRSGTIIDIRSADTPHQKESGASDGQHKFEYSPGGRSEAQKMTGKSDEDAALGLPPSSTGVGGTADHSNGQGQTSTTDSSYVFAGVGSGAAASAVADLASRSNAPVLSGGEASTTFPGTGKETSRREEGQPGDPGSPSDVRRDIPTEQERSLFRQSGQSAAEVPNIAGEAGQDTGSVRTPLDLLEPVPAGLLEILPRSVVRALILIKATQVFGRHTRALQELISTYIRLSTPPQLALETMDIPALLSGLADYLGVEPEFLIFAFRYSAGVHPGDALAVSVSTELSQGQPPLNLSAEASGDTDADGLRKLVDHLTAYRWYYEASHVKSLLLPLLRGRQISAALFTSLIRLLYEDQADRVAQEWSRVTSMSISPGLGRDPERLLDEARHTFVEATLAGSTTAFSLPRIFARVRSILQPERTGPAGLPTTLADVRGYFSPAAVVQGVGGGGRKAAIRREHAILRFYHILNLDLVLEGVGDRFFDNIPFSFELLLSKHRSKLLEVLQDHRFDPELAQFFAYTDPSGIFEQIRRVLPASQTDRISRTYRQAVEILLRSRWLTLGRNELTAFAMMDAYPYYLSPDLEPANLSDIVFEIVRRASLSGMLSVTFRETLAGATDDEWMAQVARMIGVRRRDQVFPTSEPGSGRPERAGIARYRSLLAAAGNGAADDTAALTLRAILDTGRFPEGHVLRSADPASHPDYLKRLAGIGLTIEKVFTEPGEGFALRMSGLLDRSQLIRAVAARFGLRRDQVRTLTQSWYDRSEGSDWTFEDLLEALLQSPVSSVKSSGRPALNRAALKLLRQTGRMAWWDVLAELQAPQRSTDRSLDGLKPADIISSIKGGREDWMELYFGLARSTPDASRGLQRVLAVWMRGLAIKPSAGSRRQRFRSLVASMLNALSVTSADTSELHRAWLEAHAFFDGSKPAAVRNIYDRLLRAGMPESVLREHLQRRGIDIPAPAEVPEAGQPTKVQDISFEERLLRGTITPEALAALWRPGSRDAAQILSALKSWVTGRSWNTRAADRLVRALPAQAMSVLMARLSPTIDLRRIIENWSVFLQSAGMFPDRQQSAAAVLNVIFTHRLWQFQTPRRLQVELFRLLGMPEVLRRGTIPEDVLAEGIDGVPPVFLKMAADLLSTRSGITSDELLALWPASWTESDMSAEPQSSKSGRQRTGGISLSLEVLDFLETGILPAPVGPETTAVVERRLLDSVRAAGPGGFLSLVSLHDSLVPRALEFFRPEELSSHIFTRLIEKTSDAALRRYLEVFRDLAMHTRVRQSELISFLKTWRRFFAISGSGSTGQSEAFLRAALVIPAFAQLTRRTLSAMPRAAWRATRSPFLQHIVRTQLKERGLRLPDTDALTVFFLRTGLLHPDAGEQELPALYLRIRQQLAAGDPDLRATIFLYAKHRMARKRIRELFVGVEESGMYEWILPGLTEALRRLTDLMRLRFGIDIWRATGARSVRDRQERVLAWWAQTRPLPGHVIQLLKVFMEQVTGVLDDRQWHRVRHPDLSGFSPAERKMWQELRALVPTLIAAPADSERRLAAPAEEDQGPRMNEPDTDSNPVDGITVQNGGLVILWPYLGRLFTRLGLSDGKTFPGEEEQSRAIRLTEYLVTGNTEMEEHQLALNKLLCGAPLDFQVPASIELTPEEEELCGKMLQGVIRNWEKLKTTRPNTFRETFLKREARLYKIEDRWELVVARKPYDMLLDSLPWNISMIQLSWMPERLVVHWK